MVVALVSNQGKVYTYFSANQKTAGHMTSRDVLMYQYPYLYYRVYRPFMILFILDIDFISLNHSKNCFMNALLL